MCDLNHAVLNLPGFGAKKEKNCLLLSILLQSYLTLSKHSIHFLGQFERDTDLIFGF